MRILHYFLTAYRLSHYNLFHADVSLHKAGVIPIIISPSSSPQLTPLQLIATSLLLRSLIPLSPFQERSPPVFVYSYKTWTIPDLYPFPFYTSFPCQAISPLYLWHPIVRPDNMPVPIAMMMNSKDQSLGDLLILTMNEMHHSPVESEENRPWRRHLDHHLAVTSQKGVAAQGVLQGRVILT